MRAPVFLPPLPELLASVHVVTVPLSVPFRGLRERETLLICGPAGWGEFGPFVEYSDAHAAPWLGAAIEAAWQSHPSARRVRIPVNATVPAVPASEVARVLDRFGPVETIKVKVAAAGQDIQEDVARVTSVRRLRPRARIRVDANAAWGHREALEGLARLADYELEYAEQPVAGISGLARLREALAAERIPVKIAADESVRLVEDPLEVARVGAADVLVLKVAPLGGVQAALDVAARARLPVVVSSALESAVGISMGAALAAALPELPYACGLGTVALFEADVVDPPFVPSGGFLPVESVAPAAHLLARYRAPVEREQWWRERLTRVYRFTGGTDGGTDGSGGDWRQPARRSHGS